MFDAVVLMGPLPEGACCAMLAEHGDRILGDEAFAECWRPGDPLRLRLSQEPMSASATKGSSVGNSKSP